MMSGIENSSYWKSHWVCRIKSRSSSHRKGYNIHVVITGVETPLGNVVAGSVKKIVCV